MVRALCGRKQHIIVSTDGLRTRGTQVSGRNGGTGTQRSRSPLYIHGTHPVSGVHHRSRPPMHPWPCYVACIFCRPQPLLHIEPSYHRNHRMQRKPAPSIVPSKIIACNVRPLRQVWMYNAGKTEYARPPVHARCHLAVKHTVSRGRARQVAKGSRRGSRGGREGVVNVSPPPRWGAPTRRACRDVACRRADAAG